MCTLVSNINYNNKLKNKKMKKLILSAAVLGFLTLSCGKNKCAECHYDAPAGEVEMGTYCADELKNLEELGTFTDSLGNIYEVHCGEH